MRKWIKTVYNLYPGHGGNDNSKIMFSCFTRVTLLNLVYLYVDVDMDVNVM